MIEGDKNGMYWSPLKNFRNRPQKSLKNGKRFIFRKQPPSYFFISNIYECTELELKMEFNVIQELLNYFNITVCTKECMPLNRITVVQNLLIFEWRFAINRDQAHGIVEAAVTLLPLDHLEEKIAETFYIFVIRMFSPNIRIVPIMFRTFCGLIGMESRKTCWYNY